MYNFSVFWSLLNITCKLLNYILKFFCYWHTQIKIGCDCASKSNQAESQVALWTLNEESGSPPTLAECTDWFSILDGTKWDSHVTSLRGILDYHLKSHGIITLLILKLNYPSHWSWCCRTLLVYRAEKRAHMCETFYYHPLVVLVTCGWYGNGFPSISTTIIYRGIQLAWNTLQGKLQFSIPGVGTGFITI